jgi:WD40 repeat protein
MAGRTRTARHHPSFEVVTEWRDDGDLRRQRAEAVEYNELANVSSLIRLSFSHDGQWLAAARDGHVEVWDVSTRKRLHQFTDSGRPISVALSPDKRWLVAGSNVGTLALWNLEANGLVLGTNAHPGWIFGATFSLDGKQIVTGGADQVICFWETPTNQQPSKLTRIGSLKGHAGEIWGLEFSCDGKLLVSASKDGTARLWKAEPQAEEEYSLRIEPGQLLGFSTDSRAIRMLRRDGVAIDEWNLRDGTLRRSLSIPVRSAVPMAADRDSARGLFASQTNL